MIKYLVLFLLPLSLLASKILSYNIYDRTDRADVMITFDTPFSGKITQYTTPSKIVIKLDGASIESPKIKKVNSDFLHSLTITPMTKQTQLVANVASNVKLVASKTSDGYGLRLRFKSQSNTTQKRDAQSVVQNTSKNPLSALPTKKDEGISQSYYIVVGFLLIATLILFYFKRKIQKNTVAQTNKQNNWLFKSNQEDVASSSKTPTTTNSTQVSIRFQKAINDENSVVMLDFGTQSYLVLMGKSNILLDKFSDDIPTTQEEFNTILQSRHEQLEDFLGEGTNSQSSKEPLQAYKERAASMLYNDEA
jgi:type II secretory pathway pseudopilin PulG